MPEDDDGTLEELATALIAESSRLGGWLRPALRAPVVELVRSMNGYYSNLIEGHRTLPQDIDRALSGRFRRDASRRLNQELHRAHVEADTPAPGAPGLSAQALRALCRNMLETCVDQVRFMGELLRLDRFRGRLEAVARMEEAKGNLPSRSAELVGHLAEIDALRRGAVAGLLRIPERTAQRLIRAVVGEGFAFSDTPKGPLRLRWPAAAQPFLFPGLYPAGGDTEDQISRAFVFER